MHASLLVTSNGSCSSAPCSNGGTCVQSNATGSSNYTCQCASGYSGSNCTGALFPPRSIAPLFVCRVFSLSDLVLVVVVISGGNPCSSAPCTNGGTCVRGNGSSAANYSCQCAAGYSGATCASTPANCSAGYGGANCSSCASNYTKAGSVNGSTCIRDNCATPPGGCTAGSCKNTGPSSYNCSSCVAGFAGSNCTREFVLLFVFAAACL